MAGAGARKRSRASLSDATTSSPAASGSGGGGEGKAGRGGSAASDEVQCAAIFAIEALLVAGSELFPMTHLASVQRALLATCLDPLASPALLGMAVGALHAAVGTGRATHADMLPGTSVISHES